MILKLRKEKYDFVKSEEHIQSCYVFQKSPLKY